jgi:hypothetical protein
VTGWTPAPQIVIVHRGQVVVNQRVGVNHFERAGRVEQGINSRAESFSGREQEERAKTFSTREETPTNRTMNASRLYVFIRD